MKFYLLNASYDLWLYELKRSDFQSISQLPYQAFFRRNKFKNWNYEWIKKFYDKQPTVPILTFMLAFESVILTVS